MRVVIERVNNGYVVNRLHQVGFRIPPRPQDETLIFSTLEEALKALKESFT